MRPNLVIPMAGDGSRFAEAGYTDPKPLIEFMGKKMIQHVVDAFPIKTNLIFMVRKDHADQYNVPVLLGDLYPDCKVITIDKKTEGSACTILLAKSLIDNDTPLYVMNSDNIVHWSEPEDKADGFILTFEDDHPKWSFAKTDASGHVTEVAEKNPISTHATSGVYYWSKGSDFVSAAEQMIAEDFRVKGEFYTAPVYNWNIKAGKKIRIHDSVMHGVGTPEDLDKYLQRADSMIQLP